MSKRAVAPVLLIVALVVTVLVSGWYSSSRSVRVPTGTYDVIIVVGGGQTEVGESRDFVKARLDLGLDTYRQSAPDAVPVLVVLSAGTMHRPNPRDAAGFPILEAESEARYLMAAGVPPEQIRMEKWSLDTIGNAAFTRLMHTDVRRWRRLLVITNAFHMPRTKAIFEWIFGLSPPRWGPYELDFAEAENRGLSAEAVADREAREAASLKTLREVTVPKYTSMAKVHEWLFTEHDAYSARALLKERAALDGAVRDTY